MRTWYYFFAAALAAVLLSGCGSSSAPSRDDVAKAVTSYVGMARPDMGDVKLDDLKILSESKKQIGGTDVFFRQFEARYTVTYENNPSKHSFTGTIAMAKQGQEWVLMREACMLTFADSPPIAPTVKETTTNRQEEPNRHQR